MSSRKPRRGSPGPPPLDAPEGFEGVVKAAAWDFDGFRLRVEAETAAGRRARIEFRPLGSGIWRMTCLPPGAEIPAPTGILADDPAGRGPAPVLRLEDSGPFLRVSGASLVPVIRKDPWSVRFLGPDGAEVLADNPEDIDGLGRPLVPPLGFVQPVAPARPPLVTASFRLGAGECLFGLGEKFTRLDKVGRRVVSWTRDAFGSTSERSHKNVPFLWSTSGWGFLLDTGARIAWDLGAVSTQSWTVAAETSFFDAYVIYGPEPHDILARYSGLTGRAPVPPKWSFGLWLSSGGTYRDAAAIDRLVAGAGKRRLPFDVVHVDPWWMRRRRYCDFRWDRRAFPDPEAFAAGLHRRGLKLCLWEHPYISVESGLFDAAKAKGYFARRPDGEVCVIDYGLSLAPRPGGGAPASGPRDSWNARVAIVDFTNPEARAWYKDLHRPLFRRGVAVFKTDFGEDVPADAVFHDGRTGAEIHNLYPLLYNRAVFEAAEEERGRGLVWGRSGTAGSQRYPVCWSGDPAADFASLAATVRGGLSAGLSGLPFWTSDIGGYRGTPDPELYVRWAQFGLLSSHSRMHGDGPREPWLFGGRAFRIVKRYVRLRYCLFPYLYGAALEAALTGLPVLRALSLAFPGDPNARDKDLEYMIGSSFLAAPVVERGKGPAGLAERDVYLPAGTWIEHATGRAHRGPKNIRFAAALDAFPLFVRGGAVIPMMRPALRIPEGRIEPLVLDVFPGAALESRLFEDEGETVFRTGGRRGAFRLEWSGPVSRRLDIRLRNPGPGARIRVEIDGRSVSPKTSWSFGGGGKDPANRVLVVRVPKSRSGRLSVGP